MIQQTYSLKRRLIRRISIPILIASFVTVLASFLFLWHEVAEVYDTQLVNAAHVLHKIASSDLIVSGNAAQIEAEEKKLHHQYEKNIAFRIWRGHDVIVRSYNTLQFNRLAVRPGFSDQTINERRWRFFVLHDKGSNIRIETAERYEVRYEVILQLICSILIPGLIFIPLVFVMIWLGVRDGLRPVIDMSTDVDARNSDDMSPIRMDPLPQEIVPLVAALNNLFLRIGESFQREREFTDHAAHELRTPLAAMKTQSQVLLKKAGSYPEWRDSLSNLQDSIDRSAHLVDQLLALARLQNETFPKAPVDLSECVRDAAAELKHIAADKNTTLDMNVQDSVFISGHEASLMILLRNVLGNAIKYTPDCGCVEITLTSKGTLTIADNGPGLSDNDKVKVFERFVRVDKTGQTGSGLGLPIAGWIAAAHDTVIILKDNPPRGLKAVIEWQPVKADQPSL
jgi:two-component system sensor histidine kinase QseC